MRKAASVPMITAWDLGSSPAATGRNRLRGCLRSRPASTTSLMKYTAADAQPNAAAATSAYSAPCGRPQVAPASGEAAGAGSAHRIVNPQFDFSRRDELPQRGDFLEAVAGPIFYAQLPAGSYVVEAASSEGQIKKQTVTVGKGSKPAALHFTW